MLPRPGQVQTVLGVIDGKELGVTVPHEHLLFDGTSVFKAPEAAEERELAYQPVQLGNLSWLQYHPFENLDNVRLTDVQEAIDEALLFRRAGGRSIVDVTTVGIGRDAEALADIARATGLHVVMGAGFYTAPSHADALATRSEESIERQIVDEIRVGVDGTGIGAGLIGEIGCSWPLDPTERKILRAAASAQRRTGAALSVHPGRNTAAPLQIVQILQDQGADLRRTVMCHVDVRLRTHEDRVRLLESGCYLEYDVFGWEGHFPSYWTQDDVMDIPNDTTRIYELRELAEAGYLDRLLVSQDICGKARRTCYGGPGYAHILRYVVPMMLERGMSQQQIDTLLIDNPRRLFSFAESQDDGRP